MGTLGFLCLRPPGMVWLTVFAVPMTVFMVRVAQTLTKALTFTRPRSQFQLPTKGD